MAFPYIFESNFEEGTVTGSGWDTENDAGGQLDVARYSDLTLPENPYRGAYCCQIQVSTADVAVLQANIIDIAAGVRRHLRHYVYFSSDFTATVDDVVKLTFGQNVSNGNEFTLGFKINASTDEITLGIGKASPTSFSSEVIERGLHYCVELDITLDDGVGDNGTIDLYITKEGDAHSETASATQVASLNQEPVTKGFIGVVDQLATTTGTIIIDQFVFDDTRIYPISQRHSENVLLTKSGHAFVGKGIIDNISLISGAGTDNVLEIYDTNTADTNDLYSLVAKTENAVASETISQNMKPIEVKNGAYVVLTGTNPRAIIQVRRGIYKRI